MEGVFSRDVVTLQLSLMLSALFDNNAKPLRWVIAVLGAKHHQTAFILLSPRM